MNEGAVQEIARLSAEANAKTFEIEGKTLSTVRLHPTRQKIADPETIQLHSLQGLIDYLGENQDALDPDKYMVHVKGPREVQVIGAVQGPFNQRLVHATAEADSLVHGFFEKFISLEAMVIGLQARFVDSDDRPELLRILGNVKSDNVRNQDDDGVTQTVTAKSGVHLGENVNLPNPVTLAPYRTFIEVDQPASPFVLRATDGGAQGVQVALFEADGGKWKRDCVDRIVAHLSGNTGGLPLIA